MQPKCPGNVRTETQLECETLRGLLFPAVSLMKLLEGTVLALLLPWSTSSCSQPAALLRLLCLQALSWVKRRHWCNVCSWTRREALGSIASSSCISSGPGDPTRQGPLGGSYLQVTLVPKLTGTQPLSTQRKQQLFDVTNLQVPSESCWASQRFYHLDNHFLELKSLCFKVFSIVSALPEHD